MKKFIFSFLVLGALIGFSSCSNDEVEGNAKFSLRLTDAPGDFEEVLIDVQEVKVHFQAEGEEDGEWVTLSGVNAQVYNLLDFTNGVDVLLAETEMPVGLISQIRLVLGDNNQVKVNGEYYDIKTPSAQQSGLKLNVHAELVAGVTYRMWLDFDAGRSIVKKGNGGFSLKPVIRTFTEATSGAITGVVDPVEVAPYVGAVTSENDTIGTYADPETGYFLIRALAAGDYKVVFLPGDESGYLKKEVEGVVVTTGTVTDMETVEIEAVVVE
ncbi:DUF4382 domain-containing protein [Plebeiibacterium marinum]|uniref:DUF4382 domain-containing protein n=1 Tax=Plebeiibacterium marinum TaxID=2992111 RepID=A0AAE3MI30_9BACT|nr:DUF4382 domain-containing protein [Plebeiobacterium marinum]MCW3808041.1 DUF4382 domain-containing protein [Plebeiobacterium marinum]